MHTGLRQPMKVKHRQEQEVKRCCCLWFVLFQPPGGWEHRLQMLNTKCGRISVCLFSLSFFFPNVFKALTCKSTVKLLQMPAVVQLLGTIHSVYSSTALRCTLMEEVEVSFTIIIKHYFAVTGCFSSSQLKGALINCVARWEVGSCFCPCFTDEESGALTHPACCPRLCSNSPSKSAADPEMSAPAQGIILVNALCLSPVAEQDF